MQDSSLYPHEAMWPSSHQAIKSSSHLAIYIAIHPFIYSSTNLPIDQSAHRSIYTCIHIPMHPYAHVCYQSTHLPISSSTHLPVYPSAGAGGGSGHEHPNGRHRRIINSLSCAPMKSARLVALVGHLAEAHTRTNLQEPPCTANHQPRGGGREGEPIDASIHPSSHPPIHRSTIHPHTCIYLLPLSRPVFRRRPPCPPGE